MSYELVGWKNRAVEKPMTYTLTDNGDGTVTLARAPGEVYAAGTPVNADNLNHMDEGIRAIHAALENYLIVGPEAPTNVPALWFNTDPYGKASAEATLLLDDDETVSNVQAEVDGKTYAVTNATANKAPTETTYDFTVL